MFPSLLQDSSIAEMTTKWQSRVRQSLAALSSWSYRVNDVPFLETLNKQLQEHISSCKEQFPATSGRFPGRNRRRIAKHNIAYSRLYRALQTVRAKHRRLKLLKKSKKTVQCKLQCTASCGLRSVVE